MRFAGLLLSLLLCLGVARSACAMPAPGAPHHAMPAMQGRAAMPMPPRHHDHATAADCVGCAVGQAEAAAPIAKPGPLARLSYRMMVASRLHGRSPSLRAPPPRLAV